MDQTVTKVKIDKGDVYVLYMGTIEEIRICIKNGLMSSWYKWKTDNITLEELKTDTNSEKVFECDGGRYWVYCTTISPAAFLRLENNGKGKEWWQINLLERVDGDNITSSGEIIESMDVVPDENNKVSVVPATFKVLDDDDTKVMIEKRMFIDAFALYQQLTRNHINKKFNN